MRRYASASSFLAFLGSLAAQYSTNFETFAAAAAGTPCAGQDGFYVPPVAGSIDGNIHTYAGNTLGVPVNANGGANFWGGLSAGGTAFARSQRAVTIPSGLVKVTYDVCCNYLGAVVPTNNIGSFSFQPSTASLYVNLLAAYPVGVVFPPTTWDANVVTRGVVPGTVTTVLPNPAFQGLAMNVWHTWSCTVNMATGEHTEFTIRNGVTGITTVYRPTTPLLMPVAPALPGAIPTDFRFFAGGTTAGNVFAIDNFSITDGAATVEVQGEGCPFAHSFYERFATAAAFDLANSSITMTRTPSGGYIVTRGGGVYNPVGSLGPATALVLTDDSQVLAGTLGLYVGSNGWVATGPGNNTTWNISVPIVLGNPSTAFHSSHDMNPTIAGSGQVMYEEAGALAQVTYNGVWDFGGTSAADANNVQFQINTATGDCKICWGAMSPLGASGIGHIVGFSPGGASVDPGNADLSGLGQITLGTADKRPLRLTAATRPIQGAAAVVYNLTTSNIPASAAVHLGIVGLTNPNAPLIVVGMPDCTLQANLDVISAQILPVPASTVTWSPLTLPPLPPSFSGFTFYAQGAILGTTENTAFGFGALTSNGLKCTLGLN
jgi:hypothetical protein